MSWLAAHWFDLVQSLVIVGGLLFHGLSMHREGQAKRTDILFRLTERHGELWREQLSKPALSRVMSPAADVVGKPLTDEELVFVTLVFLHLNTAYGAIQAGVIKEPEGLTLDIKAFLSLPIPREAWKRIGHLQDREFATFVDGRCRQ